MMTVHGLHRTCIAPTGAMHRTQPDKTYGSGTRLQNFENHRINIHDVMIQKMQFEGSLEPIPSASTTNAFSVFDPL